MLSKKFLQKVNERPRGRGPAPLVALGAGAAAVVAGTLVSWAVGLAVLAVGAGAAYLVYREHAKKRISCVSYDIGGDRRMAERLERVVKACGILASSEKIWRRSKPGDPRKPASGAGERANVRVGRLEKPGMETNVDVHGIDSGETAAFFFPEAFLVLEDDRYRAFSYKSLRVVFTSAKIVEPGEILSDTEVLGETYQYVLADGTPDRRFGSNPRLPEVLYGDLDLSAEGWKGMSIRVSRESAAAQFVLAFAEERDMERYEQWRGTRPAGDRSRTDPTHEPEGATTAS